MGRYSLLSAAARLARQTPLVNRDMRGISYMDFMLLLLGITSVAVFCAARSIANAWNLPRARAVTPRSMSQTIRRTDRGHLPVKRQRELASISIRECETLIRSTDGVLFVTINETGERVPLPFHDVYPLVMTPVQFANEVRWFPSNTCVVLCGGARVCSSALELLENVPEIPPIYMLRGRSSHWEVA